MPQMIELLRIVADKGTTGRPAEGTRDTQVIRSHLTGETAIARYWHLSRHVEITSEQSSSDHLPPWLCYHWTPALFRMQIPIPCRFQHDLWRQKLTITILCHPRESARKQSREISRSRVLLIMQPSFVTCRSDLNSLAVSVGEPAS